MLLKSFIFHKCKPPTDLILAIVVYLKRLHAALYQARLQVQSTVLNAETWFNMLFVVFVSNVDKQLRTTLQPAAKNEMD